MVLGTVEHNSILKRFLISRFVWDYWIPLFTTDPLLWDDFLVFGNLTLLNWNPGLVWISLEENFFWFLRFMTAVYSGVFTREVWDECLIFLNEDFTEKDWDLISGSLRAFLPIRSYLPTLERPGKRLVLKVYCSYIGLFPCLGWLTPLKGERIRSILLEFSFIFLFLLNNMLGDLRLIPFLLGDYTLLTTREVSLSLWIFL